MNPDARLLVREHELDTYNRELDAGHFVTIPSRKAYIARIEMLVLNWGKSQNGTPLTISNMAVRASESLSKRLVPKLFREPPGNTVFRYLLAYRHGRQFFTDGNCTCSNTADSGGGFAVFGGANAFGASVTARDPRFAWPFNSIVSSRREL